MSLPGFFFCLLFQQNSQQLIVISEDYEQGLRRLNRSFRRKDVASSESDSLFSENDHPLMMNSSNVTKALANSIPLKSTKSRNCMIRSRSLGQVDNILDDLDYLDITEDDNATGGDTTIISEPRRGRN